MQLLLSISSSLLWSSHEIELLQKLSNTTLFYSKIIIISIVSYIYVCVCVCVSIYILQTLVPQNLIYVMHISLSHIIYSMIYAQIHLYAGVLVLVILHWWQGDRFWPCQVELMVISLQNVKAYIQIAALSYMPTKHCFISVTWRILIFTCLRI